MTAKAGSSGPPRSRPRVAFQGEAGAFSEEALHAHFRDGAEAVPCRAFPEVVVAVATGRVDAGVLPVENTLAGSVTGAYDALLEAPLVIVGEIVHPIRHCLMGLPGSDPDDLARILSHPVALAQCTRYLAGHPRAEAVAVYDTAGAAMQVAREKDPAIGAVAARAAAERYGLAVLAADIQDRADNQTRFYVVRREGAVPPDAPPGPRLTVLLVDLADRPGSLVGALEPLARAGLDLAKIESRPGEHPWNYRFLLEVRADATGPELRTALDEIRARTAMLHVLGSFPAARPPVGPPAAEAAP